ncbi:MAG: HAMP domain-containing histidine kinase [Alloprevotella sp.]|nr:HAMP domain-containing histidine kinase [Alloprevotella sp.]
MKLHLKFISALILIALSGIFMYQVYWLSNLFQTTRAEKSKAVEEALRVADLRELFHRIDQYRRDKSLKHGLFTASVGYQPEHTHTQHTFSTETRVDSNRALTTGTVIMAVDKYEMDSDSVAMNRAQYASAEKMTEEEFSDNLLAEDGLLKLAAGFQQSLHIGVDALLPADFNWLDSVLTTELQAIGLSGEHKLLYLHQPHLLDTLVADTLARLVTKAYQAKRDNNTYRYASDVNGQYYYEMCIENVSRVVVRQMAGILATSLLIIFILAFAFFYLLRTLLHMKSLKEISDDFTHNITHELKTPLSVAYAANDALLHYGADAPEEVRHRYLTISREQLQHLSALVEQILSMNREHRQTFCLQREDVAMRPLLEHIVEIQQIKAQKSCTITLDVRPETLVVCADRTHLQNMVNNLVDNALKYSGPSVQIDIVCTEKYLQISDNGIGIARSQQAMVFEKFYRVPTGDIQNVRGYGLGLHYVRTIVQQHGWHITVDSEPHHGSRFTIYFDKDGKD